MRVCEQVRAANSCAEPLRALAAVSYKVQQKCEFSPTDSKQPHVCALSHWKNGQSVAKTVPQGQSYHFKLQILSLEAFVLWMYHVYRSARPPVSHSTLLHHLASKGEGGTEGLVLWLVHPASEPSWALWVSEPGQSHPLCLLVAKGTSLQQRQGPIGQQRLSDHPLMLWVVGRAKEQPYGWTTRLCGNFWYVPARKLHVCQK